MSNFTGTLPSWPAGHIILDTEASTVMTALTAATDAWTAFTPTWTGSTTNPAIGNGQLSAEYKQLGKTVIYRGFMVAGSTTTFGSGQWQLNWPVTPDSRANSFGGVIGQLLINDTSAGATFLGMVASSSASILLLLAGNVATNANTTTNLIPMTWASGDRFSWWVEYMAP